MNKDDVFNTRTMAKVYCDQGNFDKASEIYRHLLEREPGRQDLLDAISEVEKKRFNTKSDDLTELFIRWIYLLLECNNIQKLKKLKKHLGDGR